jgi:hypothetical protein
MCTRGASFLQSNLASHRARWGFAPQVAHDESRVRIEATTAPWPRVSWRSPDGRWLRVHSDRQPLDEAGRWLARGAALEPDSSLVCLIGAGYGYALEVLDSRGRLPARGYC